MEVGHGGSLDETAHILNGDFNTDTASLSRNASLILELLFAIAS